MKNLFPALSSLLIIGLSLSCATKQIQAKRNPQGEYGAYGENAEAEKLDFEEFRNIIETKKISKVEDLLSVLATNYPKYLSFHTFVYDSQSLQSSSYQAPRAIVFGPQAKFIFTFNSQIPGHKTSGVDAIEMLDFNSQTSSFELREVRFRDSSSEPNEFGGKPYLISKANPEKCLSCHSVFNKNKWTQSASGLRYNPFVRPIWDSYPLWRGVYGGADDDRDASSGGHGPIFKNGDSRELPEKTKFFSKEGDRYKGRYSYLPKLAETYGINADFTAALAKLNSQRIGKRLAGTPMASLRYQLLAAASCHRYGNIDDPKSFLKEKLRFPSNIQRAVIENFEQYKREYDGEMRQLVWAVARLENQKPENLSSPYSYEDDYSDANTFSPVMTVARYYGVETADWAMRAVPNGRGFAYGTINSNQYIAEMIRALFLPNEQQELLQLMDPDTDYLDPKICSISLDRQRVN